MGIDGQDGLLEFACVLLWTVIDYCYIEHMFDTLHSNECRDPMG